MDRPRGIPISAPAVGQDDTPTVARDGTYLPRGSRTLRQSASSLALMLAFTFPGQGSQRPGMGRPWQNHESWELVDEASEVAGRDVGALLCDADADELRDTRHAQLATFVSSLMVLDAAERLGLEPSFCAGHSLGEYTALTATGALGFDDGVRLVTARAAAMHDAGLAQPGTMAGVLGLDDDQVDVACRRADTDVWVANYNAPGQVVIAGSPAGVESAGDHAKQLGAKRVMSLQVSGAFHTPFMTAARDRLREALAEARPRDTDVPVVANVDAIAHNEGAEWASLLSAQLSSPVRWKQSLITLSEAGVTDFAELGPGGVLTGMAKRTVKDARTISIATPEDLDKLIEWVNASSPTGAAQLDGEHLFATERLVVSPAAGIFTPVGTLSEGSSFDVGSVIGHVAEHEVRSPFAGLLQSYIAVDTERVTARQPIAWLRTH
jgi:[acyl-carrier-protein] S-malonyltransferase